MLRGTVRCPVPVLGNVGRLYTTQGAEKPYLQLITVLIFMLLMPLNLNM